MFVLLTSFISKLSQVYTQATRQANTNSLRLKDLSLQYLRSTPLGYKDMEQGLNSFMKPSKTALECTWCEVADADAKWGRIIQ